MSPDEPGTAPRPQIEVDARSMMCPRPVIELARRMGEVEPGGLVGVAVTDTAARYDVPAWCRMTGQEFVGERTSDDGVLLLVVRRLR